MTMSETYHRRQVYLENFAKIQEHNDKFRKGLVKYSMVMNQFGHLTENEFLNKYTGTNDADDTIYEGVSKLLYGAPKQNTLPESVDWRSKGVVTQVKSQRKCAACYAFGTVASIESHYSIKHKKLVEFSEQQIIDCARNLGCRGGRTVDVMKYVQDVGLTTNALYPYEAKDNKCRLNGHEIVVKIQSHTRVNPYNISHLQSAVALLGPVTISVNAIKWHFVSGKEILIDDWCGVKKSTNHIVVVVGYNTTKKGVPYWIVKNSWGTNWGQRGYVYLERTKADKCGIAQKAYFPKLD